MQPLKIQLKLYAQRDTDVDHYIPVFHRWIRDSAMDETLIDVVDYTHVKDGPAVVLIGHDADYAFDRGDGKLGLLYANKRGVERDFADAIRRTFRTAQLVEREAEPTGAEHRVSFRADELLIRVADRLNAPNNDATYERLLPELRAGLEPLFGASGFELSRVGNERELFTVRARATGTAPAFEEACRRVLGAA